VTSAADSIVMPQLGQAMEFGSVAEWLVADGSTVEAGQPVATIESDKSAYEIEAPAAGKLWHRARVGTEIAVGALLAVIGDDVADVRTAVIEVTQTAVETPDAGQSTTPLESHDRALASPRARETAKQLDVNLSSIAPHRTDKLIVASDVEKAARSRPQHTLTAPAGTTLSHLRRTAADRLVRSWHQAPHFVQMVHVDATQLLKAVALMRQRRLAGSLNDLLIKTLADVMASFPELNARFQDGRLVPLPDVSVGLAVATDEGLIVPVVRHASALSLSQVASAMRELIEAARERRLDASQMSQASLTLSNLGRYGIAFGTPVLNLDEPILVFVGAIEARPVVREGAIVVGDMMTLSVCFDHRVVDGVQAAQFSQAVKNRLESLDSLVPEISEPVPDLAERELRARSVGDDLMVSLRSLHHAWQVDEPVSLGGKDSRPDPVTLALGSLLSCMIIAFKHTARRRKVSLERVDGLITATPAGKVASAAIRLTVYSSAPTADVTKLLAPAKALCLVHDMLRADLGISIDIDVQPASDVGSTR
jgi:pyruvate dehydrogenase E2 component (dihydrolipoamide acetyltransferase)